MYIDCYATMLSYRSTREYMIYAKLHLRKAFKGTKRERPNSGTDGRSNIYIVKSFCQPRSISSFAADCYLDVVKLVPQNGWDNCSFGYKPGKGRLNRSYLRKSFVR